MSTLNTPLTDWHIAQNAKMAPFAGWNMPIQYSDGIIQEHLHTRSLASVFDICHMGEFLISGPGATEALSKAISTNLATLKPGKCRYGFLLNGAGGILDDLITYRLDDEKYLLVVNAACIALDYETLRQRLPAEITMQDVSDETGKIDLQGPASRDVLLKVLPGAWTELAYFSFVSGEYEGAPLLVSRTGYTGEFGYELYVPSKNARKLWELLLTHPDVKAAGLGARDTLRLEAGLPLNGQDIDPEHSPAELGYTGMLTSEADYAGKAGALEVREVLTPLLLEGRRSARHGHKVLTEDGREAGIVTSGSFGPSVGHAVALAYIKKDLADRDSYIIQADKATLPAKKGTLPFYTKGTARMKIS